MGKTLQSIVVVLALAAVSASGFYGGKVYGLNHAPKVLVYDLKTDKFVALPLKADTNLYVASPSAPGMPGVVVETTKQGVLVWPLDMAQDFNKGDQPDQPAAPQNQSSNGERLDRTRNL
jgi:hypothetical protein